MLKFLIIITAMCALTYYTYWAATGEYYDIPFFAFI